MSTLAFIYLRMCVCTQVHVRTRMCATHKGSHLELFSDLPKEVPIDKSNEKG